MVLVKEIDPKINYQRFNELSHDLMKFLTRLEGFYLDAVALNRRCNFAVLMAFTQASQCASW